MAVFGEKTECYKDNDHVLRTKLLVDLLPNVIT